MISCLHCTCYLILCKVFAIHSLEARKRSPDTLHIQDNAFRTLQELDAGGLGISDHYHHRTIHLFIIKFSAPNWNSSYGVFSHQLFGTMAPKKIAKVAGKHAADVGPPMDSMHSLVHGQESLKTFYTIPPTTHTIL